MVPRRSVVWIGAVSVPETVTVPVPLPSVLLSTVVANGVLLTVTPFTRVTPRMFAVHEPNVWAVVDSVATPGATGLSTTAAVNDDSAHLTPVLPPEEVAKSAVVPVATVAGRTSPTATAAPAGLPVVRTATSSSAANAGDPARATDSAATAVTR